MSPSESLLVAEEVVELDSLEILLEVVELESLEVLLEVVEVESREVLLEREDVLVTLELTEFLRRPRPSPRPPRPSWMEQWDSATFMSATPLLAWRLAFLSGL